MFILKRALPCLLIIFDIREIVCFVRSVITRKRISFVWFFFFLIPFLFRDVPDVLLLRLNML